jgi:CheY-like chemotaxis protein/HPt (histidine-containing phosphotransfer) domain-containing protein
MDAERPLVVVVDDDASIRHLVSMAFEDFAIDLRLCATVAEARAILSGGAVRILITDMMMPGETGLDLLDWLKDQSGWTRDLRVVMFSAGPSDRFDEAMGSFAIADHLHKPVSVQRLCDCLTRQLEDLPARTPDRRAATPAADSADPHGAAIAAHFGGDAALYRAFRSSCLSQFSQDIEQGDRAAGRQDARTLQLLGHSLKSVLELLGHPEASECARELERISVDQPAEAISLRWPALRHQLVVLALR